MDFYIIDNALSGLDTQTADEIVHRVLGPLACCDGPSYLSSLNERSFYGYN